MSERVLTPKEIEWFKQNYPIKANSKCSIHLKVSVYRVRQMAKEMDLHKQKNRREDAIAKPKKKKSCADEGNMNNYCIDCSEYVVGGTCSKTGKAIGALWNKKCFEQ